MDIETGKIYPNLRKALDEGVPEENLVEVSGDEEVIKRLSEKLQHLNLLERALKEKGRRRKRNKLARKSRKVNRR